MLKPNEPDYRFSPAILESVDKIENNINGKINPTYIGTFTKNNTEIQSELNDYVLLVAVIDDTFSSATIVPTYKGESTEIKCGITVGKYTSTTSGTYQIALTLNSNDESNLKIKNVFIVSTEYNVPNITTAIYNGEYSINVYNI